MDTGAIAFKEIQLCRFNFFGILLEYPPLIDGIFGLEINETQILFIFCNY